MDKAKIVARGRRPLIDSTDKEVSSALHDGVRESFNGMLDGLAVGSRSCRIGSALHLTASGLSSRSTIARSDRVGARASSSLEDVFRLRPLVDRVGGLRYGHRFFRPVWQRNWLV